MREDAGWSYQQAIIAARGKKHSSLTVNKLRWIEEGKTKHPDREVLAAIADIYELEYPKLAAEFVEANYGRDLIRHVRTGQHSAPHPAGAGGVDGAVETRLRELLDRAEQQRDVYKKIVERAGAITSELADILRAKSGPPPSTATARRGRARRNH